MQGGGRPALRYRPGLDGVRAIAVAGVLLYHGQIKLFRGGFVGVDVFFVLSGFLITSLLLHEGAVSHTIRLGRFWLARARRLLPAALLVVIVSVVVIALFFRSDLRQLRGDALASVFYFNNWHQILAHRSYFEHFARPSLLQHFWSLSVEEQFYVIWSVLMVVAVAAHRRRLAYAFAIAGIALSIADRLWIVFRAPHFDAVAFTRAYYAFDSRADALFIGCLLGLLAVDGYLHGWKPWATRLLSVSAGGSAALLVWILVGTHLFTESVAAWWLPVSAVAAAVVIAYFVVSPAGIGSRFAGIGFFVFMGNLSYTVYLVHFPVYLAISPDGTHWSYWPTETARLAVTFAIAIASWYGIEKPLARWRRRLAAG